MSGTSETPNSETQTPPAATATTTTPSTVMTPPAGTSTEAKNDGASESAPKSDAALATAAELDFAAIKPPEGFTLSDEDKTAISAIAKETGLTQPALEKLSAFYFSRLGATVEGLNASVGEEWTKTNKAWAEEIHTKFGGDEARVKSEVQKFQPIIDRFGGDKLREALAVTGAGNHPAVFDFFTKLTATLGEGTPVGGNSPPKGAADPAKAFYSNSPELFKE